MIVTLAGAIGSGKSTLAKALGRAFDAPAYSFSGYVRSEVEARGLDAEDRTTLQDVGHELVTADPRTFLDAALKWGGHVPGHDLVLDGLRHLSVLEALKARQSEGLDQVLLLYIETPKAIREQRVADRGVDLDTMRRNEAHPAEHDLRAGLASAADRVLDGGLPLEDLIHEALTAIEAARKSS